MIGCGIAYSLSPIHSVPLEVARTFFGGLVAAPFIGLLIGIISRKFEDLDQSSRVALALMDLYVATWFFLLAASIARLLGSGLAQHLA
jgi:hypothetical protein